MPKHLKHASNVDPFDDFGDSYGGRPRRRPGANRKGGSRNPRSDPNDVSSSSSSSSTDDDGDEYDDAAAAAMDRAETRSNRSNTSRASNRSGQSGGKSKKNSNFRSPHQTPTMTSKPNSRGTSPVDSDMMPPMGLKSNSNITATATSPTTKTVAGAKLIRPAGFLLRAERALFKTEFCPSLEFCREYRNYGWCDDAHSMDEWRCSQFALTGKCPRGDKCPA